MVSHAAYPAVTKATTPASISRKWITDILRKKIGYRGLIASDDLEMGGVLSAVPIERASAEFVRAGGDLGLICHKEEFVTRSYEELVRESERDRKFERRVEESVQRVLAFKKRWREIDRRGAAPSAAKVQKLSRQLWELGEQVRLAGL